MFERMTRLAVLTLALLVSTAHADPKADVTGAFASFIDAVATNKPAPVELFIVPGDDDGEQFKDPVPADLADTRALIASPKLKATTVVVSAGGKSAWVAGEIAGKIERGGKTKNEPIRVSAFLAKTDKGWRVIATHWSTGEPDASAEYCGMLDAWEPVASIPIDAAPLVKQVFDALDPVDFKAGEGPVYDTSKFGKILSDDKNAYAIGSAPKELFSGAKIKAVFKKWKIQPETDEPGKYPARAGLGPDGEMAWLVFGMRGPEALCVSYRTFMVLAKEASGWKVVHQHYSRPHH
jgi:ketosteroid isomerase-like protein